MLTKKSSEAAKNSWHYFSPLAAIAACFLITATTKITRSALLRLWCSGTSIGERMPRIWADWNGFPAFGVMAQST
jgi:hypothetical protein